MQTAPLISLGLSIFLVLASSLLRWWLHASPVLVFIISGLGVAFVADWIRRGTDQLAAHAGSAIGGLISVTFGNVAELLLAVFVLVRGEHAIVRAQITGSIIGTTLLGLGLSVLIGGLRYRSQTFNRERAGLLGSLLILAVIALLLPAVFDYTGRFVTGTNHLRLNENHLSLGVAVVLLGLYAANLVYTLITRRDVFSRDEGEEKAEWSVRVSLGYCSRPRSRLPSSRTYFPTRWSRRGSCSGCPRSSSG